MHSHLTVEVGGKPLTLAPDQSIDIEDRNPLFNDTEMFSYPIEAPVEGNGAVFGIVDDTLSAARPTDLEHLPARIIVDGLPLRSGVTVVQDGQTVSDRFSVSIDASANTFNDLVGDLRCRDVPMMDDIVVGEKLSQVEAEITYDAEVVVGLGHGMDANTKRLRNNRVSVTMEPQGLGFSYPGHCEADATRPWMAAVKSVRTYPDGHTVNVPKEAAGRNLSTYINVSDTFGENSGYWGANGAKYANARVCYQHKGLNDDGSTSDSVADPADKPMYEDHWPYWVLDADRPMSGLCFYVRYFLRCLFAHLGVNFDDTALDTVQDFNRLVFFSTRCAYSTRDRAGNTHVVIDNTGDDGLTSKERINQWLESRGCGGQLDFEKPEARELDYYTFTGDFFYGGATYHADRVQFVKGQTARVADPAGYEREIGPVTWIKTITHNDDLPSWGSVTRCRARVLQMFATSDNWPDTSVTDVLDSLEASFGLRFRYDYEQNRVTAYLMRDIFRQRDTGGMAKEPRVLHGTLLSAVPLTEKITGVRMKYSAESDGKEQMDNIRTAKRDYDTDFDYIDYPSGRTVVDREYKDIFTEAGDEDMNVYVDLRTGNAYRVKIDSDATTVDEKRPVWFEVGQFKGVEVGDCSPLNEDYVREFVSSFQPMSWNDVNFQVERAAVTVSDTPTSDISGTRAEYEGGAAAAKPLLAAYSDEDMEHEFVLSKVRTSISPALYTMYATQLLTLTESYDPSGTDSGSPLQEADWGLAIALMRGGGSDASVQEYDYGYDGFGNDKWRTVSGEYAMASDTIDQFGNEFDYNGDAEGIGDEDGRFSLKIRAWKPFLYYTGSDGRTRTTSDLTLEGKQADSDGHTWQRPFSGPAAWGRRGLFDTFMAEYAWFLLHRVPLRLTLTTTVAQLADIPNHWTDRWRIGDLVGYIDRIKYSVSAETGLSTVEMDFFAV